MWQLHKCAFDTSLTPAAVQCWLRDWTCLQSKSHMTSIRTRSISLTRTHKLFAVSFTVQSYYFCLSKPNTEPCDFFPLMFWICQSLIKIFLMFQICLIRKKALSKLQLGLYIYKWINGYINGYVSIGNNFLHLTEINKWKHSSGINMNLENAFKVDFSSFFFTCSSAK